MKTYVTLILFLMLCSCSENDDDRSQNNQTAETNINLVTGLDIRADENSVAIRLGNPNILQMETLAFPNPAVNFMTVKTFGGQNIEAVWILNGDKEKIYQDLDFTAELSSELYTISQFETEAILTLNDTQSNELLINLEALDEGYYRLFIQANGTLEWHNIYVGAVDITNFIESWD